MKLIFLLMIFPLLAFQDPELMAIWSTIQNINNPTIEEYQKLQSYLASSRRPYLDELRYFHSEDYKDRLNRILQFQLVSSNYPYPISQTYSFNVDPCSDKRCIILYASANGIYPQKAKTLLSEIENSGYSGHILLKIGGFPNTEFGGLKLCHIPYAFKVAALQEARLRGFTEILWIDLAIHPMSGFEPIFWEIEQNGTFFTNVGSLQDNFPTHLTKAAHALGITTDLYAQIPHISSSMIGLNLNDNRALELLDDWYAETQKGTPCITWWPEELALSVIAWRLNCNPTASFGRLVCGEGELNQLSDRSSVQFYLDAIR